MTVGKAETNTGDRLWELLHVKNMQVQLATAEKPAERRKTGDKTPRFYCDMPKL